MKSLSLLAVLVFNFALQEGRASDAKTLVEKLKKTAQPGNGISQEEQKIATNVQDFGPAAIPYLLPLLRDNDEEVRELASYTLRDIKGIQEQHLDALIESRRRGDGWIPPAIARIGTPKAVTFLVGELVRERQTQSQLTWAIKMLGAKALPELIEVYQREQNWDDKLEQVMSFVFNELGPDALTAIDPLLKIANDEEALPKQRVRALTAVGSIGLSAGKAIPDLQRLQDQSNKEISEAATSAILNIGSEEAAPLLAERLEHSDDPFEKVLLLRDIAELKTRGKSAGLAVAGFLNDQDWDVRVAATRALGDIGYEEAVDDLIQLLNRVDDWRMVLSAAESLGRLKAARARPALIQVAREYWYPLVREAARKAVEAIRTGVVTTSKHHAENFSDEFFGYVHAGGEMEILVREDAGSIRFPVDTTQDELLTVAIKDKDGAVKRERRKGVEVEEGYLIGSNRGEWGGEMTFLDFNGNPFVIEDANTEAIYKTKHGIIAVTGLAHLATNSGFIQTLNKGIDGGWTATKWRALPGAPIFSRLLKDGGLLISCYGGIVLVPPSGEMVSLTRSQALQ